MTGTIMSCEFTTIGREKKYNKKRGEFDVQDKAIKK
jgi:hypothetical protein